MNCAQDSMPMRGFLIDVWKKFSCAPLDYYVKNEGTLRLFQLGIKFAMLQVTVEEIKETIHSRFSTLVQQNNRTFYGFLADLEIYFYLIQSSLDMIARFTCHFYPESHWKEIKKDKKKRKEEVTNKKAKENFTAQIAFIKRNAENDPEYARYLAENLKWFEKAHKHRNELAHNCALTIFFSRDNVEKRDKIYFGTKLGGAHPRPEHEEVVKVIEETYQGFNDFIEYYNSFFSNKNIVQ